MYLFDSNVFMHIANRAEGAERIERRFIAATAAHCVINPVIAAELRCKIESGPGRIRKHAIDLLMELLDAMRCVPLDGAAGQEGGVIFAQQAAKGRSIAMPDALIAGHARHAGLILVSLRWHRPAQVGKLARVGRKCGRCIRCDARRAVCARDKGDFPTPAQSRPENKVGLHRWKPRSCFCKYW